MITLTALVAHGHYDELAMHVRAARRNGLTPEEIGAVLLQTAVYCGVPAANSAFATAQRVLAEEGGGRGRGAGLSYPSRSSASFARLTSPSAPQESARVRPRLSSEAERARMPYSTRAAACSYWQGEASR